MAKVAAAHQADVQRHVQARDKAALLHQRRQKLGHPITAQQGMAQPAEQVGRIGFQGLEQVTALDHRIFRAHHRIEHARRQQGVIGGAQHALADGHADIGMLLHDLCL
ncbi:hypothetical protein D3C79_882460 [compost metagenome]